MSKSKKKPKVPRNSWVKVMMDRFHGNMIHRNKKKKRKNNPSKSWKKDWDVE
jgi:hypothetical protein